MRDRAPSTALGLRKGEVPVYAFAWHPKLVLLPTWQLDTKARLLKRLIDLSFALTGLVAFALPSLIIMLAIRLDSAGPVLFRQERIGLRGRGFLALKFRTMHWRHIGGARSDSAGDPARSARHSPGPMVAALFGG